MTHIKTGYVRQKRRELTLYYC